MDAHRFLYVPLSCVNLLVLRQGRYGVEYQLIFSNPFEFQVIGHSDSIFFQIGIADFEVFAFTGKIIVSCQKIRGKILLIKLGEITRSLSTVSIDYSAA